MIVDEVLEEKNKVIGTRVYLWDVTDLKRAENKAKRLKDFNEGLLQNMSEGLLLTNDRGYLTFVNSTLTTMLGYTREELVGKHWTTFVPSDQHSVVQKANKQHARGKVYRYELSVRRKDGSRVSVLVGGKAYRKKRKIVGSLAVLTDITEQKKHEKELQNLVTNTCHLINTPLTIALGQMDIVTLGLKEMTPKIGKQVHVKLLQIRDLVREGLMKNISIMTAETSDGLTPVESRFDICCAGAL